MCDFLLNINKLSKALLAQLTDQFLHFFLYDLNGVHANKRLANPY